MATTTGLNVRKLPSTSSDKITTLAENTAVAVIAKGDGWYEVLFNETRAYMSADYLKAVYGTDTDSDS